MKVTVLVRPKPPPPPPPAPSSQEAKAQVERMCQELLANPLIESFEIEVDGA